jgi:RNA polymerase sigma-70 factor (ECF subfamily)
MSDEAPVTMDLIARMNAGDRAARDELFARVGGRLAALAAKMLRRYPGVARWCQTGDVVQGAQVRLLRALEQCKPAGVREFFSLSSQQIRRELIDLLRHFHGPEGEGANHASVGGDGPADADDATHDPARLADWAELHQRIGSLPEDEKAVVELLYYQGLTQDAASELLGVSTRTVQRRWQSAVVTLHEALGGRWPGM